MTVFVRPLVAALLGVIMIAGPIATWPADASEPKPAAHAKSRPQYGLASWYGRHFDERTTASGETFSPHLPTAACRHMPIGTHLRVTNLKNGRATVVRVNDRGPYARNRIIDLSQDAARQLGMMHAGVARVRIEVVGHDGDETERADTHSVVQ